MYDTKEHITQEGLKSSASTLIQANVPVVCTRMAVGRCALTTRPTAINQDLKALLLREVFDSRFFIRLLKFHGSILDRVSVGSTVRGITTHDLLSLALSYPDKSEQSRMAAVLDTVDEAIAETEVMIVKLKQVRAGLLHDLLTRGLDAHDQLRDPIAHPEQFHDSPFGWIPREWEIKTLNELVASAVDGPFGSNLKTEHYVNEPGVQVVRLQNIESGWFNESDQAFVSEDHALSLQRHQVVSGDLLVASRGDENHPLARACLYPAHLPPGIVKADCFRLRMKTTMATNGFVMLFLNCPSTRRELNILGQGVTRDRVNLTTLLKLRVLRPPVEEQRQIVKIIDALDLKIRTEEALLAKLAALKSGLMSDLLTGRVRVPEEIVVAP